MNNLQSKFLLIIFENVPIDQMINRCKLVCKRWNQLINQNVEFSELVIRRKSIDRYTEKNAQTNYWHSTNRPINLNRTLILTKLDCFYSSAFRSTFCNLKFLKFTLSNTERISLRSLNALGNLEHLEIDAIHSEVNVSPLYILKKPTLSLLKLKTLKLPLIKNHKFKINSNKLEHLICNRLKEFKIVKPETIRLLEVKAYNSKVETNCEDNLEHFGVFLNLKILKIEGLDYLDREIISKLPNSLKELHLFHHFRMNDTIIEKVKYILGKKYKEKLRLKIFLQNCELKDASTFDGNNFMEKDELKFIARNYEHLNPQVSWYTNVDFIKLLAIFNQSIPDDFFKKFSNVQQVILDSTRFLNVDQQKDFYTFLSHYPNLIKLFLHRQLFNQQFYNNLASRFKLIEELFLYPKGNTRLNTQFVFKFELLRRFQTDQDLKISSAIEILNNLRLLRKFVFFNNANQIRINRCKNELYELIYLRVINDKEKVDNYQNLDFNNLIRMIVIELYKDLLTIETRSLMNNRLRLKIKAVY